MRTSKPFATISYNTEKFLEVKLKKLINQGILDFYAYIKHLPEEDELKEHIHLWVVPSELIETKVVLAELQEFDKNNPDKPPLGCIPCVSSKFDDWYLYGIHDKNYLATKGQARKYSYQPDEVKNSNAIYLRELVHKIDRSKFIGVERIKNAVADGVTYEEMVCRGQIPVQLINQYRVMYEIMFAGGVGVYRGDRVTHTPKDAETGVQLIDPETGEIIRQTKPKNKRKSKEV